MPRKSISEPVFDEHRQRWRVTIPESLSENNKRVRSWHKTREAARKYIAGITGENDNEGPAAVIPPTLAMKADEARSILEPYGLDLVQAAREVANALKTLDGAGSIQQAAKAFRATHDARHSSKPLCEAVKLFLKSRENLRDSTQKSYTYSRSHCGQINQLRDPWSLSRGITGSPSFWANSAGFTRLSPLPSPVQWVP